MYNFHGVPSELCRSVLAFMRKAVRKRSRLLKPAGLGSLEGLSSMESALPVSFLPVPTDSRALGRRTRSSKLNFWLKWKRITVCNEPRFHKCLKNIKMY